MSAEDDPKPAKPRGSEAELHEEGSDKPTDRDKPDEGLRPDQLTTETDGGSQG